MNQQRIFDLTGAVVVLILLAPIAVVAYPLLLWLIGSPVIFRQNRAGLDGQFFTMYKLRSMYKNAEDTKLKHLELNEAPWPMFKISNDPRFIKKKIRLRSLASPITLEIGRFLSRSGLDELPQFFNVLRGEMSLVGPRPLPIDEALALQQQDPNWCKWRHSVRPGIFSAWALDSEHNRSLSHWKKLEKSGLQMRVGKQMMVIWKIIYKQLRNL